MCYFLDFDQQFAIDFSQDACAAYDRKKAKAYSDQFEWEIILTFYNLFKMPRSIVIEKSPMR